MDLTSDAFQVLRYLSRFVGAVKSRTSLFLITFIITQFCAVVNLEGIIRNIKIVMEPVPDLRRPWEGKLDTVFTQNMRTTRSMRDHKLMKPVKKPNLVH